MEAEDAGRSLIRSDRIVFVGQTSGVWFRYFTWSKASFGVIWYFFLKTR